MLERMDTFFENRLSDYDEHMLTTIEGADKFYKYNASLLPRKADLGVEQYSAAVSVESLHHFTSEQKLSLYRKLLRSLKTHEHFILTDYCAESKALEAECFETLEKLKREQGISDHELY